MAQIRIVGLLIKDRIKEAGRTQRVLSEFADIIKSRLGSHELSESKNSRIGTIILELTGDPVRFDLLEAELDKIGGIEVKSIMFNY